MKLKKDNLDAVISIRVKAAVINRLKKANVDIAALIRLTLDAAINELNKK